MSLAALALTLVLGAAPVVPPSSLERLGEEIRAQLLKTQPEAPVAMVFDGAPPVLARSVATVTASKLANAKLAPIVLESGAELEARASERGARTLLRVTVSVENQKLVARGDAYSVWVNFWSGRSASRSPKAGLIVASLDADSEALTLAGAALPTTATPSTLEVKASVLAKFVGAPAAIASGDLDGDGRAEVLVVVNEEVLVFSADGRSLARYDLAAAPPAAVPTRDAFAAMAVLSGSRVVVWSGKRARAEVLTWSSGGLRASGFADSVTIDGLGVKLEPGFNSFSPEVVWSGGRTVSLGVGPQVAASRGALTLLVMPDGSAALVRGAAPTAKLTGVGAGSTLADLDGDGVIEAVLSGNHTAGEDEVRVLSTTALDAVAARGGTLSEAAAAWQSSLARGRALAASAADLDGVKGDEVILATSLPDGTGELLVLHRDAP